MAESLKDHLKRRAFVIAERQQICAVTSLITNTPQGWNWSSQCLPGDSRKQISQASYRRPMLLVAEGDSETRRSLISSSSSGVKTLAVLHRCMNSGDSSFLALCSKYSQILEVPTSNPYAQMCVLLYDSGMFCDVGHKVMASTCVRCWAALRFASMHIKGAR
eukprot:761286-Hanusia_phi.AAC.6